jgi:DNA-binding MarR family transcriptional regulator
MTVQDTGNRPFAKAPSTDDLITHADLALFLREQRIEIFGSHIKEAGWDILLALYTNQRSSRLTISKLTKTVPSPATTIWRWLKYLEDSDLVTRVDHPLDARASIVSISEHGKKLMDRLFVSVASKAGSLRGRNVCFY